MANLAQGAVQVQYSPPGHLQFAPFGPQRTLCHQFRFLTRHNPKLFQNLLRVLPSRKQGRAASQLGYLPWIRSR